MRRLKNFPLFLSIALLVWAVACTETNTDNKNTTAASTVTPAPTQVLKVVPRPQTIVDLMKQRGEQDVAKPTLKILSPADKSTVTGSKVELKLALSGDLKGYMPHKDPTTGKGNHIHVILDNQPYEAYYETGQPFELRNVIAGNHTLRVFPSRPWHESYKSDGAFQIVAFTVKGGGDPSKPTTTSSGQTVASPSASPTPTKEGKDFQPTTAGNIDVTKAMLTYSRPKGEYKGADSDPIMIDFWLTGGKLKDDGGEYRVRYIVDNDEPRFIDKWEPIWLSGWTAGKHTVRLELLDKDGKPFDNGGYNITTREISVVK